MMNSMCRLAAYLAHNPHQAGAAVSLDHFFTRPAHSLYRQAWEPRELRYARLNADGFGVAWWTLRTDAQAAPPARYVQDCATWNDLNLPNLGRAITATNWLGSVRSATAGQPLHTVNSQPFVDDAMAFAHNGYLGEFRAAVRARLHARISPEIAADLIGSTDSEHLFALVRQHADIHSASDAAEASANKHPMANPMANPMSNPIAHAIAHPIASAVADTLRDIQSMLPEDADALLNIIVSTHDALIVAKHAVRAPCPSLYATDAHPDFPGWLVASEAFDEHPSWQPLPDHSLVVLRPGSAPSAHSL